MNEINIALLGRNESGKSSLIAGMNEFQPDEVTLNVQDNPEDIAESDICIVLIDTSFMMKGYDSASGLKDAQRALSGDNDKPVIIYAVNSEGYSEKEIRSKILNAFRDHKRVTVIKESRPEDSERVMNRILDFMNSGLHLDHENKSSHNKFLVIAGIIILGILAASFMHIVNKMNESIRLQTEQKESREIARLKAAERKAIEQSRTAENKYAEEIEKLKESEHRAIIERNRAQNEAELLRSEKESLNDTANRYKNQIEALRKENEKLKSEVARLTKKLDNSLVRIANPFKH